MFSSSSSSFKFIIIAIVLVCHMAMSTTAFVTQGSRPAVWRSPMHVEVVAAVSTTTSLQMAVAAPAPVKKEQKKVVDENITDEESSKDRGWLVRLYNDPMNKREFVARCLQTIVGLDDGAAYTVMMKAHQLGISVVGNYPREMAEMYKMRLSEEGLLIDMVPADDEE